MAGGRGTEDGDGDGGRRTETGTVFLFFEKKRKRKETSYYYEYKTQIKNITKKEKADGNTYKILFDNNESINVIGFEDFDYYKIDS